MEYVKFGKLGFEVSRFGLGCMRLPIKVQPDGTKIDSVIDEDKAIEMIRYAIDHGVNYVDTAHGYHGGNGKVVLGKALRDGYRAKVKLATKLPPWNVQEYSDMEKLLESNLEALQTDCIDFYLLHSLDKTMWDKMKGLGVLKFLDNAISKGKIRYPAFSFHGDLAAFKEIIASYDWKMCQIQFNLLDVDEQAGIEGLHYAASKEIPVVIMEPLKGGKLSNKVPADILKKWDEAENKRSPQAWAFNWLADMPEVTVVLSGSSTLEQLKDSLEIFKTTKVNSLTPKELMLIEEIRKMYESKIKIGCTGCNYCTPCPSGVAIPEVFRLYNEAYMYDTHSEMAADYKRMVENGKAADKCIECKKCEKLCPQGIKIISKLKEVHGHFLSL